MTAAASLKVPYSAYVAAEEKSPVRHDYLQGDVFAMAGGSLAHGLLISAAFSQLAQAVAIRRNCTVFEGSQRVRSELNNFACYPDLSVVCGRIELAPDDPGAVVNPVVVVEVLSASTESYDRGEKSRQYRAMPSIQEIVLISQHRHYVEISRRTTRGTFELHEWLEGDARLESIDALLAVELLYAKVESLVR